MFALMAERERNAQVKLIQPPPAVALANHAPSNTFLKFLTPEILPVLQDITDRLSRLSDFNMDEMHKIFDQVMEERELKLGKIAQPVRGALTGGTVSPGIFEVMDILGKDEVLRRLNAAISVIPDAEVSNET